MRNIYLIDTENVNEKALKGFSSAGEQDLVILFVTCRTSSGCFSKKKVENIIGDNNNVKRIHVLTGGKNSLDFQLVSYLGLLIGSSTDSESNYYIVSKDKGFYSSINLLSNCSNVKIDLIPEIPCNTMIENNSYIQKIKAKGYRQKTAIKIMNILNSCDNFEKSLGKIKNKFCPHKDLIENLTPILQEYYDINMVYTKQDTLIYLNKIKSKGFKTKTAEKATKILKDSVSQEQAVKMMRLAFGPNSNVLSKMNSIVKEYYSEIV